MNLGIRWDHYLCGWSPAQQQLPDSFGPVDIPASTFPTTMYFTWNKVVPRLGLAYNLTDDAGTVAKVSWGLYGFDPGIGLANSANPNESTKSVTYTSSDNTPCAGCIAGDGIYQPGEEGKQIANALAGHVQVDPALYQPTATQTTAYLERQLSDDVGARVGFVYYTVKNQVATFQPDRPASAYTVPFTVTDPVTGSALTLYGIPNSQIGGYPATTVLSNRRRMARTIRWSSRSPSATATATPSAAASVHRAARFPRLPEHAERAVRQRLQRVQRPGPRHYRLPVGRRTKRRYRFQAGTNYARTLTIRAPASCGCTFSAAVGGSRAAARCSPCRSTAIAMTMSRSSAYGWRRR